MCENVQSKHSSCGSRVMLMAAFAALTAVSACGGAPQPPAQQQPSASAPASAPAAGAPAARVYFVEPKDGASVKSCSQSRDACSTSPLVSS